MRYLYKGYSVDYDLAKGKTKATFILYLHGWLGNKNSFSHAQKVLNDFSSICISFPPYKTAESILPLTMFDYKNIVLGILMLHNIKKVIIVCHSFGCRIALLLVGSIKLEKLIITGGAGIKPKWSKWRQLDIQKKLVDEKMFSFGQKVGSKDYIMLDGVDKQTFKNIVNFDLSFFIKKVDCPTLLYWGKKDKQTPRRMYKTFAKKIKNVTTRLVDGGHFAYIENDQDFVYTVKQFIGDENDIC